MKITVLGTNGWYDTPTGNTTCVLIQTNDFNIILDAGNGMVKINGLIDYSKPCYLFLTHLHLDHTFGLHALNLFKFQKPLKFIVPIGQEKDLFQQLRSPFMMNINDLPFSIDFIKAENLAQTEFPFKVNCLPLVHAVPDTGYRFEIDGKIIAFILDTGYCDNAVKLAENADLAITECGALPGKATPGWPHNDPIMAAKIASEAKARQMLLIHFSPAVYTSIEMRKNSVEMGRSTFPNLITGVDDMEIIL